MLKIEEVASETGLTKRTIRYYEELGLLPSPKRSDGGIRLYTQEDIVLLNKIVSAKEVLGFSLQELHKYVTIAELLRDKNQKYQGEKAGLTDKQRKEKLVEIDAVLSEQLELLARKLDNIVKFQSELTDLRGKVQIKLREIGKGSHSDSLSQPYET
ncbi:MerR family transcriptional regulator [Paenibacillus zeisoli]|uniref:MerR family transcriptional regulator n=1 Tax=Paenibacillus zeisoli TaxID=2496267 RepID=UPI001FE3FF68|nr:MerR family transcriptional regulator [Paenibacillus zeisoli]